MAIPLGSNDSLLQVTLQKAYEELAGVRSSVKAGSAPLSTKKGFVNRVKFLKYFISLILKTLKIPLRKCSMTHKKIDSN